MGGWGGGQEPKPIFIREHMYGHLIREFTRLASKHNPEPYSMEVMAILT